MIYRTFFDCRFVSTGVPEEQLIERAREAAVRDLARVISEEMRFMVDQTRCGVVGVWEPGYHGAQEEIRRLKEKLAARDSLVDQLEDELYKLKEGKTDG